MSSTAAATGATASPAGFWHTAAHLAAPADLPALATAAEDRGLLRDAARLRKHATALRRLLARLTMDSSHAK